MKIDFPDQSYIEIIEQTGNKMLIVLAAKDKDNRLIANTVELNQEEFSKLIQGFVPTKE